MGAVLRTDGLAKSYGRTQALAGVELSIDRGEVVGLLGPNGAGKSTLAKIACGLVRADSGRALVCGHPAGTVEARRRLGYLPEIFSFPPWARGGEVLALHQRLSGVEKDIGECERLLGWVGLAQRREMRYGGMSRGMKQRLGIAQALVGGPDLIVLDEPTNGLDPQGRALVRDLLGRLRDEGAAVLLSSHLLGEVERVCDRVAVLSSGELIATGPPGALAAEAEFQIETDLGVRSYPGYSREQIAAEIESLVASGRRVFRAGPRQDGLERAYLDLLEDRE